MTGTTTTLHPLVEWAQRDSIVYVTIEVDRYTDLELTNKSLHVKGTYSDQKFNYEATLEFYADVKTDYRRITSDRHLELVITKENSGWWPRLLKDTAKLPWVKVDFNKWKDEDEDDEDVLGNDFDFQNYMSGMGASGGDQEPNLDGFGDDDDDDDADMPDLEDADDEDLSKKKEETVDLVKDKDEKMKIVDDEKNEQVAQET